MLGKLFGRASKAPAKSSGIVDGVDLDSGKIYIDDDGGVGEVATSEVFRESAEGEARVAGGAAKIFVLDIAPFLIAIKAEPGSHSAHTLQRFCENTLTRMIGPGGTCEPHGDTLFFFRLNMDNDAALRAAVKIVNDIGTQYLRDAFRPEKMVDDVLQAVDAGHATASDGRVDAKKALAWRDMHCRDAGNRVSGLLMAMIRRKKDAKSEELGWSATAPAGRPARVRVQRGAERRQAAVPSYAGPERRRRRRGRRLADDPNKAVW